MRDFSSKMVNDRDEDSTSRNQERRRRWIEMRRLADLSSSGSTPMANQNVTVSPIHASEEKRIRTVENSDFASSSRGPEAAVAVETTDSISGEDKAVFGMMSVAGRSREMEDAISIRTNFCRPVICQPRSVHFFAVFDGHGGRHVAALCRERMHVFLQEELMRVETTEGGETGGGNDQQPRLQGITESEEVRAEKCWARLMRRSFERMDAVALSTCSCVILGGQCGCQSTEAMVVGGSTALVSVLTPDHIVVASCGDSRAVLCRGGAAIPLSFDHKPDRLDEHARINAAGGRVIYLDGARVEGILAMSRAIGDKFLKPVVTSEPDITYTRREPEDECLILASDGLWDVLSNDMACEVVRGCLREGKPDSTSTAATLLTRLALGRKSDDNISVIVVDLKMTR